MINKENIFQHKTVFLQEAIDALNIKPDGIYVDGTFGRGGHSRLILEKLGRQGRLISIDRDLNAQQEAKQIDDSRFTFIHGEFSRVAQYIDELGLTGQIDGFLLDLGVSSPQLDDAKRGFSFMRDGPLDMRMDCSKGDCASEWLQQSDEESIAWVLKTFGEERMARKIARAIVEQNRIQPITRTLELAQLIERIMPRKERNKHPATRTFQAIRIYINSELAEIKQALVSSLTMLASQGRLAVISFHSLEDRIVKQFIAQQVKGQNIPSHLPLTVEQIRALSKQTLRSLGKCKPTEQEIASNVRSRSAILRIAEKI